MKKYRHKIDELSRSKTLPESDSFYVNAIVEIGLLFINAPYKTGTLEGPGKEKLIVNVSAFDCTTFVETVLALAKWSDAGKLSRSEFRKNLKLIRYRQGKIDGYSSRLHYFTDWLRDNEKKKIIKDLSRQFDTEMQRKKINYMTINRASYPALKNEFEFRKMRLVEKNLSRKVFHIISKDKVSRQKTKINNGDVIAFTTKEEGLDVAHTGFAIWQGKNLNLLHASSKEGGVVVSKKTLVAYLKSNKKFTGIIIARFP
ncbi:MAG: N-acetylmuramoyl-L-alanine amidase-like domain-containing protein [Smithella sp.]